MPEHLRNLMKWTAFGMPMAFAWTVGLFQSTRTWLLILLCIYLAAPLLGIARLSPGQLLQFVLQKPDSWVAIITLVVAIVAAGSFLASKRLDMRLAAADDIQRLLKEFTDVAAERRIAADALAEFRKYAVRYPKGTVGNEAASDIRQVAVAILISVPRVSKDQGRMWDLYKDALALRSRHRLALSNSSICILAFDRGLRKLEELAAVQHWMYPMNPDSLDDLYAWAADGRSSWVDGYSAVNAKLSQSVNVCFGASAGAVAGMLFTTSAAAAWLTLRGMMEE